MPILPVMASASAARSIGVIAADQARDTAVGADARAVATGRILATSSIHPRTHAQPRRAHPRQRPGPHARTDAIDIDSDIDSDGRLHLYHSMRPFSSLPSIPIPSHPHSSQSFHAIDVISRWTGPMFLSVRCCYSQRVWSVVAVCIHFLSLSLSIFLVFVV